MFRQFILSAVLSLFLLGGLSAFGDGVIGSQLSAEDDYVTLYWRLVARPSCLRDVSGTRTIHGRRALRRPPWGVRPPHCAEEERN
jgi:hypothetical protein